MQFYQANLDVCLDSLSENGQDSIRVKVCGRNINMSITHSIRNLCDKYKKHIELFGLYTLIYG